MIYKTVFNAATENSVDYYSFLPTIPLIILGWFLVFRPEIMLKAMPYGGRGLLRRIADWSFFIGITTVAIVIFITTFVGAQTARNILENGHYSVIEGTVTHFIPMPRAGHSMESFTIGDQHFSYSDYSATAGFRNTASHGGPIREGLHVRVTYINNLILKLEIAE